MFVGVDLIVQECRYRLGVSPESFGDNLEEVVRRITNSFARQLLTVLISALTVAKNISACLGVATLSRKKYIILSIQQLAS